ncbi:hypothetical protein AVEN_6432-1, partial [Araneus ventricosus]
FVVTHGSSILNNGIDTDDASSHRTAVSVADSTKTKSEWNRYDLGCGTT